MEKENTHLAIILIAIIGICLLACLSVGLTLRFTPNIHQYSIENSSLKVGDPAPDFELPSLNGENIRLSQFQGQPVLLTFGASWCPDCRIEAPLLQKLHENNPELVILLVDSKENIDTVQNFANELFITHPILLDQNGEIVKLYQVFAIPTELFIDANGIIKAKLIERVTPELLTERLQLIGIHMNSADSY